MAAASCYLFSVATHSHLVPYLAALHASCITNDHMISDFLPPLNHEKLLAWWKDRISEVNTGSRVILLLLLETDPGTRAKGPELMGVVMLGLPTSETGSFRGHIEGLLVSPKYRGQGGAKALLGALEDTASRLGRTLLVRNMFPRRFFSAYPLSFLTLIFLLYSISSSSLLSLTLLILFKLNSLLKGLGCGSWQHRGESVCKVRLPRGRYDT